MQNQIKEVAYKFLYLISLVIRYLLLGTYRHRNEKITKTLYISVTTASEPQTPAQLIDYNFAREELMLNELSNDPIQTAIAKIERQHEEDKQGLLFI